MLSFLNEDYEYDVDVKMPNGKYAKVDFKTGGNKYIEVIDSEDDAIKFKNIHEKLPTLDIIAVGHPKYVSRVSEDRKSTRLNSSHANISYAVFCLKKKNTDS